MAAWFEATQLAGFAEDEAKRLFPKPRFRQSVEITLDPLPPQSAKEAFLERYEALRFAM